MIRRRNQFMDWKITIENRFLSFLSTPSFRYKPKPYILCLSPKLNLGLFLYTSLKHDATPLKAKIESSLYQDFHVLYVHIERDKKQEGNESEKLSQFCCRAHQKLLLSTIFAVEHQLVFTLCSLLLSLRLAVPDIFNEILMRCKRRVHHQNAKGLFSIFFSHHFLLHQKEKSKMLRKFKLPKLQIQLENLENQVFSL